MIVPGMFRNKGMTGYNILLGNNPDISQYVEFEFYYYCWYWDSPQGFPHDKKQLGIWIGVAQRFVQPMIYYFKSNNRNVIFWGTVSPLESSYYNVNETNFRLNYLDNTTNGRVGDYLNSISENKIQILDMGEDDLISKLAFSFDIERDKIDNINEEFYLDVKSHNYDEARSNDVESEAFHKFLCVYIKLPRDDKYSKVLYHVGKKDNNGKFNGTSNYNPIINMAV